MFTKTAAAFVLALALPGLAFAQQYTCTSQISQDLAALPAGSVMSQTLKPNDNTTFTVDAGVRKVLNGPLADLPATEIEIVQTKAGESATSKSGLSLQLCPDNKACASFVSTYKGTYRTGTCQLAKP
jgi:hypothetical protein